MNIPTIAKRTRAFLSVVTSLLLCGVLLTQTNNLPTRASGLATNGDIASLPHRPDILLAPLAERDLPSVTTGQPTTTAQDAVALAESQFHLNEGQLDSDVGIVRATVSILGDPGHRAIKAWVVTANVDIRGQSPATSNTVYHKLCIVIDASTHAYSFAYTADPQVLS